MTNRLVMRSLLGLASQNEYFDWAIKLSETYPESQKILDLMGLGLDYATTTEQCYELFKEITLEMGIQYHDRDELVSRTSEFLCTELINGAVSAESFLFQLGNLYCDPDCSDMLSGIWNDLAEDVWMINEDEPPLNNQGLTKQNKDGYIKDCAAQYLKLKEMNLNSGFLGSVVCKKCNSVDLPIVQEMSQSLLSQIKEKVFRPNGFKRSMSEFVCSRCKSTEIEWLRDYNVRESWIKSNG